MKQVERKKLKERPNSTHLFSCIKGGGCKGSPKRPKHLGGGGRRVVALIWVGELS